MTPSTDSPLLSATKKIAFVQAGWHSEIVEQAYLSFVADMAGAGVDTSRIDVMDVPGSLEIPLQCQHLARTGQFAIIVAAGLIVDGGIYRHDFVAATVLDGMMRVQLDTDVPILSVVLTPHHFNEQQAHIDFFREHFKLKGAEAASACIQVLRNQMALSAAA